jgi:hypothetical protein
MRARRVYISRPVLNKLLRCQAERPRGVHHVIDDHAFFPLNIADQDHLADFVGLLALLGENRQVSTELLREGLRPLRTTGVRTNDNDVVTGASLANLCPDVILKQRHRIQIIDRIRYEPLQLTGVQVDCDDTVCTGELKHICDKLSGYRGPRLVLFILPRIAEERHDCGDTRGTASPDSVHHDEQLHQVLVRTRVACGLDDEDVAITHRVVNDAPSLTVFEVRG